MCPTGAQRVKQTPYRLFAILNLQSVYMDVVSNSDLSEDFLYSYIQMRFSTYNEKSIQLRSDSLLLIGLVTSFRYLYFECLHFTSTKDFLSRKTLVKYRLWMFFSELINEVCCFLLMSVNDHCLLCQIEGDFSVVQMKTV